MKIAFIGYNDSFKYNKIGGTDSIIRRLSDFLSTKYEVHILNYGTKQLQSVKIGENIIQKDFLSFDEMLLYIKNNEIKNSISVYLKPLDRIRLLLHRKQNPSFKFHSLVTVYNENSYKRWLLFLESSITYNGNIYCISKRIHNSMNLFTRNNVLLLPPVNDDFFLKTSKNFSKKKKIRISYMGRLDYGKGADIAFDYFNHCGFDPEKYEFYMYSYPWKNDKFSLELHRKLLNQKKINYIETKLHDNLPKEVDKFLANAIDNTDLFFLPYRFMRSTIDAPLVPMEIMARNKPFLTTNIGGIKDISYHKDALLEINELKNFNAITKRVNKILKEKYYISDYAKKLEYQTSKVAQTLLESFSIG